MSTFHKNGRKGGVRIWYTNAMDKNDVIILVVFSFFIGIGLGYYSARLFFGG